jgi:3D (Asp-Asp-Asp) domain-containing protein
MSSITSDRTGGASRWSPARPDLGETPTTWPPPGPRSSLRGRPRFRATFLGRSISSGIAILGLVYGLSLLESSVDSPGPGSDAPTALAIDAASWEQWIRGVEIHGGTVPLDSSEVGGLPLWAQTISAFSGPVEEPAPADSEESQTLERVTVTGYSSRKEETDDTPFLTAMCTRTAPGVIALSRDLLRTFTPGAPFDFGDRILVPGVGIFSVEDTMNERWTRRADIWFASTADAYAWGERQAFLLKVEEDTPVLAYRSASPEPGLDGF